MRVTRIHVELPLAPGMELDLPEAQAGHLVRVLRLRAGDAFVLFSGDGHDYQASVLVADRRVVRVRVGAGQPVERESPLRLVLLQGIARGEKMDLILQKATELGVAELLPLSSDRSEVRLDPPRAAKRLAHWRSVVAAACEQSWRARVPAVAPPRGLAEVLGSLPAGGLRLLLDPEGDRALTALRPPAGEPVYLAIGPEGGWSDRDREQLHGAGFAGLRLGPRILRTETAGLAAVAALQACYGDLR
ncbi:16S rRNA (uracil(1498)-N(3))-methyltransferase [Lysobacter sp. GX 14042]|uniref:16S rRNA (uracil(1498)-N(3))-methyltransferase n=1 Tax=Lysobacter sp. GX 14042 TaxID=2907155 RepID=UPI001F302BC2|nr:16S rRNA (uracil(1498)-N(3))-methyltransferase [Lysobacter sp. GX 14042]